MKKFHCPLCDCELINLDTSNGEDYGFFWCHNCNVDYEFDDNVLVVAQSYEICSNKLGLENLIGKNYCDF